MISSISTKSLRGKSSLEKKFLLLWHSLGGPELEAEHRFAEPRKWRFDFARIDFIHRKSVFIAIELEGGIWLKKSGHNTGTGISRDCEKINTAQLLGWKVFRLTTDMINARHVQPIVDLCK